VDEQHTTAAIVLIGNELLSGRVTDENGPYLLAALRDLGVGVRSMHVVTDDVEHISDTVARAAAQCDFVFTSGGVGPTHDDVTLAGLARAFDVPLIVNEALQEHIVAHVPAGDVTVEAWLKMAQVPRGCALVYASDALWPVYRMRNVFVLPGIPAHFRRQFDAIREQFRGGRYHARSVYCRVGEGVLAGPLMKVSGEFPEVTLGSYPELDNPDYQVRVSLESKDRQALESAYRAFMATLGRDGVFKIVDGL
jgi:molybdenum cofactor synthesis domain-containing protein